MVFWKLTVEMRQCEAQWDPDCASFSRGKSQISNLTVFITKPPSYQHAVAFTYVQNENQFSYGAAHEVYREEASRKISIGWQTGLCGRSREELPHMKKPAKTENIWKNRQKVVNTLKDLWTLKLKALKKIQTNTVSDFKHC